MLAKSPIPSALVRSGSILLTSWFSLAASLVAQPSQVISTKRDFNYLLSDGKVVITEYRKHANGYPVEGSGILNVPAMLDGNPVVGIGPFALMGHAYLKEVNFPVGIRNIDRQAFYGCKSLTSVVISSSVRTIGINAFANCPALVSVTIYPGVTTIEDGAFAACSALDSIWIPDSVTSIPGNAFSGCKRLRSIQVDSENPNFSTVDGVLFDKQQTAVVACSAGGPTEYTIPDSVTRIASGAFFGCFRLRSLKIPPSVTLIEPSAFGGCSSLTSIKLPHGIESIPQQAFYGCYNLKKIEIQDGLRDVGKRAFAACRSLTEIDLPEGTLTIGEAAFASCKGIKRIRLPSSLQNIGSFAFDNCDVLDEIRIPPSVTVIGKGTFSDCKLLRNIVFPARLKKIGDRAFSNCPNLSSVSFSGNAPFFINPDGTVKIPQDFKVYYYRGRNGFEGNRWYGFPAVPVGPEVSVQLSADLKLTSGSSRIDFGELDVDSETKTKTFTIKNVGVANLVDLSVALVGQNVGDFAVTKPAKSILASGEATTFKATFDPTKGGPVDSTIRVSSSDDIQREFDLEVSGSGSD